MKEHPLLLSTEMVLAFLADRKQVTRRIPGPTNSFVNGKRVSAKAWNALSLNWDGEIKYTGYFIVWSEQKQDLVKIEPIYQPGHLLWFRETWGYVPTGKGEKIGYKADYDGEMWNKWRPSIRLPKEAARLWAEVTTVSCEHVQDITEEQAIAEGLARITKDGGRTWKYGIPDKDGLPGTDDNGWPWHDWSISARKAFATLWGRINGPESWQANPPVYAINFKSLSKTGRPGELKK